MQHRQSDSVVLWLGRRMCEREITGLNPTHINVICLKNVDICNFKGDKWGPTN